MRRAGPNKQGFLDGLCGIYALTNFMRDWRVAGELFLSGTPGERSDTAFWMLLDAADRLRMLNPDYILTGYASHHLAKIWNTLADEADLQCHAVLLSKLKRLGRNLTNIKVAECIYEENKAQALILLHNDHWYLSTGIDHGKLSVADSISRIEDRETLSAGVVNKPEVEGLAILQERSKILACVRKELERG